MKQLGERRRSDPGTLARCSAAMVGVALLLGACSSSGGKSSGSATIAQDSVAAAEAGVSAAKTDLNSANAALTESHQQFCSQAKGYVAVLDRYGKLFSDSKATVGD